MTQTMPDRRAASKVRVRGAILDAARTLIAERDGGFSVDELAERADVARRTVFNHFASLDEVRVGICVETLDVVVAEFLDSAGRVPAGDGDRDSLFDELALVLRECDLPSAIVVLDRTIARSSAAGGHAAELSDAAFARVGTRLVHEVERRYPGADALDVELLVGSLMNGVSIIAKRWVPGHRHGVDARARAAWDRLLERLLGALRSGFLPA